MLYIILTLITSPFLYLLILLRKNKEIKRILVIQTAKIGDLICTTPLFREIKQKYPHAHITAAVNPAAAAIIKNNPRVNEILPIVNGDFKGFGGKIKLACLLKNKNFDVSLSLLPNLLNNLSTFWALIPIRISILPLNSGSTTKFSSLFSTYSVKHQLGDPVVPAYLKMLKPLGINSANQTMEIFSIATAQEKLKKFFQTTQIEEGSMLIGIAVSCANKLKEWERGKFAELADRLTEQYHAQIILIGSQIDRATALKIQNLMKNKAVIGCGEFNLEELATLIKKFQLFISVDTGIIYMATALGIPTINIAGPCDMRERPLGGNSEVVQKKLDCVPCSYTYATKNSCANKNRHCIKAIEVNDIMNAVKKLI